jgi:hypothetical protein
MRLALIMVLLATGCQEYNLRGDKAEPHATVVDTVDTGPVYTGDCPLDGRDAEEVGEDDYCFLTAATGGFEPVVEWTAGEGRNSNATVAVADLDGDGLPEIVANFTGWMPASPGDLVVLSGDGGRVRWERSDAMLGYAACPAVGDLDGDGQPEIVAVRGLGSMLPIGNPDYYVVAWDALGNELWQSERFSKDDFDYATGVTLADMDRDGSPEIVAGRVILHADGSTRGVGQFGRGSWGNVFGVSEASLSAVTDLDLDGIDEVVTGNAVYAPDGKALWHDPGQHDGMIAIANLDDDPMGEFIAASFDTVRAIDTDGRIMWGPFGLPNANIVSPPAVADIDVDGYPEIIVAGGSRLFALNHDGSELWSVPVTDVSGATGASIFDFEGDGIPEVVYIDEVEMAAYDGLTGAVKFWTSDHTSTTMMDYPVIADVDGDNQAEIIVAHDGHGRALSVYGDRNESWASARPVWNQHAYWIDNISDELEVSVDPQPNFATHNSWHSAIVDPRGPEELLPDLRGDLLEICDDACDSGVVRVEARVANVSAVVVDGPIPLSLHALTASGYVLLATAEVDGPLMPGWASPSVVFEVDADAVRSADGLKVVADDDGAGIGTLEECSENNNHHYVGGPFCSE